MEYLLQMQMSRKEDKYINQNFEQGECDVKFIGRNIIKILQTIGGR